MRYVRFMPLFLLLIPVLFSCNKDLNVNAKWEDVTVVYGLLDCSDTAVFLKITKAFLGEGNALQFAKVPDSSNYPNVLDVRMDEYANDGVTFRKSYSFDTLMIHHKQPGDSAFFYYPDQLLYYSLTKGKMKLDSSCLYKLLIKNKKTGKEITAETRLVSDFTQILPNGTASFIPGRTSKVKWHSTKNGNATRYQLDIRFYYIESLKSSPSVKDTTFITWQVFNDYKPTNPSVGQDMEYDIPGNSFYTVVGAKIKPDSLVTRVAYQCLYTFSVAAPEFNTYIEVTEPSIGIIQEKPAYTNITNGIGLFSSRFLKPRFPKQAFGDTPGDFLGISQVTVDSLKGNSHTKHLGF
ncbi:MAG: hypothetical protein ACOYNC_05430 [Bacteroidales bacterium]